MTGAGGPAAPQTPATGPGMTGPVWEAAPQALRDYFALEPLRGDNPIGSALREDWIQLTMAATPGTWTGYLWHTNVPTKNVVNFADLFFGDLGDFSTQAPDPSWWNPTSTPVRDLLGAGWWQSFATTLVTQAIANVSAGATAAIKVAAVQTDLDALRATLRTTARSGYALEFAAHYATQLAAAVAAVGATGWQAYQGLLLNTFWISGKKAQQADDHWDDAAWELFHHAIKLGTLGATADDITAVLTQIVIDGQTPTPPLALPADFSPTSWGAYTEFLPDPAITWQDLADGVALPDSTETPHQPGRVGLLTPDNEGNAFGDDYVPGAIAYAFVRDVATQYYIPPKGSCFTANARVLLPDGTDLALADVRTGQQVWTPDGPRAVRVAVQTSRQGRTLYQVNGNAFAFADSHPFVDGRDHAASLGVHVARTATFSPGLAAAGLAELTTGAELAAVARDGSVISETVAAVADSPPVAGVDEEMVDLVLEPGEHGFPCFAVGDGAARPFYLVRPEAVRYETYAYGTIAGIGMLTGAATACGTALAGLERADGPAISELVRRLAHPVLSQALAALAGGHDAGSRPEPPEPPGPASSAQDQPVAARVDAILDTFTAGGDGLYDWRLGALQEALAANLLIPIHHAVLDGWHPPVAEAAEAAWCAVTVHDLLLSRGHGLSGPWGLDLLVDATVVGSTTVPSSGLGHHRPLGWSVPTAVACREGRPAGHTLGIRLTGPDGQVLTGALPLPATLPARHADLAIAVTGPAGSARHATARLGLRLLDESTAADHPTRAPDSWDHHARVAYAQRLGAALAERLGDLFPAAVAKESLPG